MRILQIIQKPQLRGAELFASQLSNHLLDAGHEVLMIALMPGDAALPFRGELIKLNRPVTRRLVDLHGWCLLAGEIREFNPDVVQANAGDTLKFAVFSKMYFSWNAPIVFRNANKVSDFITSWTKLVFNKFLMGRVSHVISVSELCRQDFIRTYGFSASSTTTVPIGIEVHPVNVNTPVDLAGIFENGKILVHAASFVPEKNHEGLLRIVRSLIDKGEDVKAILIGDGRLRPNIQQQISDLNLGDHVFLLGYRTDVLSIISRAKVVVLPSRIEGLPAIILEAMYCRTPVVAYDVGGISEVVKTSQTGWLVRDGDEDGFCAAVQQVLNGFVPDAILDNAFTLVAKEFDNKSIARRFLDVYVKMQRLR